MEKNINKVCLFFLFSIFYFLFSSPALAAVLYFSPSTGSNAVGSVFAVSIYVSSAGQAINAVSGVVSFPEDKFEITSLSKSGSIINMWVQEPSFSNSDGTVNFEGIVPNPGFTGASGEIITINFKVKSIGSAIINFSSGSVLANDGNGTDILKSLGTAQFSLSAAVPIAPVVPVTPPKKTNPPIVVSIPTISLPSLPQISSSTNPDPSKWYNNNNPEFSWQLSSDIIAVRTLYNKYPGSQPMVVHKPAISEIDVANLKDGVYYFHLQFENSAGWGPVSHFRFQIDTQPPKPFVINLVNEVENDNPQPAISFATTDDLSGIDYYKVKINNGDFVAIPPEKIINNSYVLPLQAPGRKEVFVMALDKAGNYAVAYVEFVIKSITPPVITDYPKTLENDKALTIKGQSYPDSQIIVWLQRENASAESRTTTSDSSGNFTFTISEQLVSGDYIMWVQVVDERGAKSDNSDKITIEERRSTLFEIESWITDNIITFFLCIALFLLIILLFIRVYRKRTVLLKIPRRQKHP